MQFLFYYFEGLKAEHYFVYKKRRPNRPKLFEFCDIQQQADNMADYLKLENICSEWIKTI